MFLGSRGTGDSGRLAIGIGIGAAVGGHADVGCRHELSPTSSNVGGQQGGFGVWQNRENLPEVLPMRSWRGSDMEREGGRGEEMAIEGRL